MTVSATQSRSAPSIGYCVLALIAARIGFKLGGFGRTIGWVRSHTSGLPRSQDVPVAELERIASRFSAAAAVLPMRVRCLEQSVALFTVARRRGIDVQLRVGVQPYGFVAHAWIEYRGQPIFEPGEMLRQITRLPDFVS
jgi:hypothetical protein